MKKIKLIISSAHAAIISSVFVVIITILAELSPALKNWLKGISGHHWTTKSIFTAIIFVVSLILLYLFGKHRAEKINRSLVLLLMFVLVGSIAITAFYTGHHFKVW